MLNIWMNSIARAGGIEVPPNRYFVAPAAPPEAAPEPQSQAGGRLQILAHWLQSRLAAPARRCEV